MQSNVSHDRNSLGIKGRAGSYETSDGHRFLPRFALSIPQERARADTSPPAGPSPEWGQPRPRLELWPRLWR
jgi:hypothetical protein